jgi:hypothetical protein
MTDFARPVVPGEFTRLNREKSLRLLADVSVGRLIFTVNALPTVRPMNFVLAGGLIVLRTAVGSAVTRKANGAVVAFEAELDACHCARKGPKTRTQGFPRDQESRWKPWSGGGGSGI